MAEDLEINDPQLNQEVPQQPPQQPPLDYPTYSAHNQANAIDYTSDMFELTSNIPSHSSFIPQSPQKRNAALNTASGNLGTPPDKEILSITEHAQMLMDNAGSYAYDPIKSGTPGTYNASFDGLNFQRYYKSEHFNKLGFNPYRDNEKFYNENTTIWDDWNRGNEQFWNVFSAGYNNYFTSWADIGSGGGYFTTTDLANADKMHKAMAIGSSSRDGTGAWAMNTMLNTGMTFGMIGAFLTEEAVLATGAAIAGIGTGGPGAIPFVAGMGRGVKALYQGVKTGVKYSTIGKMGRFGGGVIKDLRNINNLGAAKVAWNTIKGAGKVINPFENMTKVGGDLYTKGRNAKRLHGSENVYDFMDGYIFFGAAVRDARNINMAMAEAKLEGGLVENEVSKKRYDEILANQDTPLTAEQVKEVMAESKQAGMETIAWNAPFIYMTNKIVFDGIATPFRPFRSVAKNGFYKMTKDGSVEFVKHSAKPWTKQFYNPRTIGRNMLKYSSRNVAEGVQELYQEGLAAGMNMYYGVSKDSGERGGYYDTIIKGMNTMKSKEGFGIFMSGFAMGGMVGSVYGAGTAGKDAFNYFTDRKAYKDKKTYEEGIIKDNVIKLNKLFNSPIKYANALSENGLAQIEIEKLKNQAEKEGDYKTWHDLKNTQEYIHVATALKTGMFDGYIQRIKQLQELDDTALKEAFSQTMNINELENVDLRAKLDSMLENAENIKKRKQVADQMINAFDYNQFKPGTPEYINAQNDYLAFEDAKDQMVFLQHSFDKALERRTNIANSLSIKSLKNISASEFTVLLTKDRLFTEIELLQSEINTLEDADSLTKQSKEELKNKKLKKEKLDNFLDSLLTLETKLNKPQSKIIDRDVTVGDSVKLNTPAGGTSKVIEDRGDKVKLENGRVVLKSNVELEDIIDSKKTEADKLFDIYVDYVKSVAKSKGEFVTEEQLEDSFQKIIDYHTLTSDLNIMEDTIDKLLNPGEFEEYRKRFKTYRDKIWSNKEADIKRAYDGYQKLLKLNKLVLNKLYDAGYFTKPHFVQALLQGLDIKIPFYYRFDIDNPQAGKEVTKEEDLKEIQDILNAYYEEEGINPVNVTKPGGTSYKDDEDEDDDKKDEGEDDGIITTDTKFEDMPEELQNQIKAIVENEIKIKIENGENVPDNYMFSRIKNAKPGDKIFIAIKKWNEGIKPEEKETTIEQKISDLKEQLKDKKLSKEIRDAIKNEIDELENKLNNSKSTIKTKRKSRRGMKRKGDEGDNEIIIRRISAGLLDENDPRKDMGEIKTPIFTETNKKKILNKTKTTTIRTANAKITPITDSENPEMAAMFFLDGTIVAIRYKGFMTVEEAGGKEIIIEVME